MKINPPTSITELQQRASQISGCTLQELAEALKLTVPNNLSKSKGFVGQLIELCLGADAGSKPIPDFYHLGVELKTIPIDMQGKPLESTYVCVAPLMNKMGVTWATSEVRAKLAKVLWIPVQADSSIAIADRRVGTPLFWSPTVEDEKILQQDWEELTDMICLGELEKIHAKLGTYLQIRPKAANAKALCYGINAEGDKALTLPRGFYLRSSFTSKILQQHYL